MQTTIILALLMTLPLEAQVAFCAESHGLDPALVREVAFLESSMDPLAVGDNGESVGLMQINENSWAWFCRVAGIPEWSDLDNRFDTRMALWVSAAVMQEGLGPQWSTWDLAQRRVRE